jgi:SNF2 family DNA or RNA helicase
MQQAEQIVEAQSTKTAEDLPDIPLIKTSAWHHQKQCFWYVVGLWGGMPAQPNKGGGAGLFLEMGCGKTLIAIALIQNYRFRRVLIVSPKSVMTVWPTEFQRHAEVAPETVVLNDGTTRERARELERVIQLAEARHTPLVVIANYDAIWRSELGSTILGMQWDCVVCDEVHRAKSAGGKVSMYLSRLADKTPYRLGLTGTPLPHSPLCAYGSYRILDKGIFGTSFTMFRARYAVLQQIGANIKAKKVIGFQNQDELQRKMYSIAFRVKAEDVQDLPEIVDVIRTVKLGREALRVYGQLKQEFVTDYGNGQITAGNALTRLLRLQQIAAGFVKHDDNIELGTPGALVRVDHAKEDALTDILEDLAEHEPVVVFCRFRHDLQTVHDVAAKLRRASLELSGDRNELKDWQDGKAPIIAVQIQSGGIGIDATRARYAIYFSLSFSLGEYLQSRKRIHRPGQTRSCTIYHLVAEKTVDQQIYAALEAREEVVNAILQQGVL